MNRKADKYTMDKALQTKIDQQELKDTNVLIENLNQRVKHLSIV